MYGGESIALQCFKESKGNNVDYLQNLTPAGAAGGSNGATSLNTHQKLAKSANN